MSNKGGGGVRRGPPAHANRFAYHHNKGSVKTQKILRSPIAGLCQHCRDVVEWRKQFRKYKPLTTPKKCVACDLKAITMAYHVLCDACAGARQVCAKCMQANEILPTTRRSREEKEAEEIAERERIEQMSERQRRTYLRNKALGRVKPGDPVPTRRSATGEDGEDGSDDDDFDGDDFVEDADDEPKAGASAAATPSVTVADGSDDGDDEDEEDREDEEDEDE